MLQSAPEHSIFM